MTDACVLLVDTNELYGARLGGILEFCSIHLLQSTPARAPRLLQSVAPGAILLDLDRGARESVRVLGDIRKFAPETPLLWIAQSASPTIIQRARASGAQGVLLREASPSMTRMAVKKVLQGGQFFETCVEQRSEQVDSERPLY